MLLRAGPFLLALTPLCIQATSVTYSLGVEQTTLTNGGYTFIEFTTPDYIPNMPMFQGYTRLDKMAFSSCSVCGNTGLMYFDGLLIWKSGNDYQFLATAVDNGEGGRTETEYAGTWTAEQLRTPGAYDALSAHSPYSISVALLGREPTIAPEPAAFALSGVALGLFGIFRRLRRA